MIDMYSHILFGVDDGPKDLQQTLDMLQQAVDEGISEMIATSHCLHPQYNVTAEVVLQQISLLQQLLSDHDIPLKLHTGQEVRLVENIVTLYETKEVLPLANSKYMLLELPSNTVPIYAKEIIIRLQEIGIIPIIAHPERNKLIAERPSKLDEYHLGYLIYFFMKACAMGALLLEVNPFDQPGVEAYKKKMMELLQQGKVTK